MSDQPFMNETPCQHGNYACPLCDAAPKAVNDLDRFTETELTAMHADAYQRALAHFEAADLLLGQMAGLAYPSAAYSETHARERAAMAAGTEAHELLRAIRSELDTRRSTNA